MKQEVTVVIWNCRGSSSVLLWVYILAAGQCCREHWLYARHRLLIDHCLLCHQHVVPRRMQQRRRGEIHLQAGGDWEVCSRYHRMWWTGLCHFHICQGCWSATCSWLCIATWVTVVGRRILGVVGEAWWYHHNGGTWMLIDYGWCGDCKVGGFYDVGEMYQFGCGIGVHRIQTT